MESLAASAGPVLDLVGWVAAAAGLAFLVAALVAHRRARRWRTADGEIRTLEGQLCVVWTTSDDSVQSEALTATLRESGGPRLATHGAADRGVPGRGSLPEHVTVHYVPGHPHKWRLEPPEDHAGILFRTAGALGGLFLAAQALGLAAAAAA